MNAAALAALAALKTYLFNISLGLDQLANTLLAGDPDETLSARAWRTEGKDRPLGVVFRPLIDLLAWPFEGWGHCRRAFESEQQRRQLPPEYRVYPIQPDNH